MIGEGGRTHAGLFPSYRSALTTLGADVVVTRTSASDPFQHTIAIEEVHPIAVGKSFLDHCLGIHPVLEMEHVARIASQQSAGKGNSPPASSGQSTERISLSRASTFHFVYFIADEEVEIPVQVPLHVVGYGKPAKPGIVSLPERRAASHSAGLPAAQNRRAHLYAIPIHYGRAAIGTDRNPAAEIESGPPRIGELRALSAHHIVAQTPVSLMPINGQYVGQTPDDDCLSPEDQQPR